MKEKNSNLTIIFAGIVIGLIGSLLVLAGNPKNMGFCIACFVRDTAGGLGLHRAAPVQYIRPEIIGLVLGSFIMAVVKKEFLPRGGSAPFTRFVLGFFVMVGCLMFLGCPFRMILRLAGGDLNALSGLVGFVLGIGTGVFFLNKGYTLKRTYKQPVVEGALLPVVQVVLLVLLVAAPAFIFFSEEGPGSMRAAVIVSLIAGLVVGALAQRTRLCMVGGFRDLILFKDARLISGFISIFAAALICNLILTAVGAGAAPFFKLGFAEQPIAHTDALWNALGMYLTGFACILLGGCPLRQLILSGEGSTDSAITVVGLLIGAAFCHNFGLASSGAGATPAGKIAVIIGIAVTAVIACVNTFKQN